MLSTVGILRMSVSVQLMVWPVVIACSAIAEAGALYRWLELS